jgi:hypothetical protein
VLVDPDFLPIGAVGGEREHQRRRARSDIELASRLSFFLWSSIPDDELLRPASRNELGKPAVLERQVSRMLADPRSRALVTNFGGQWLHVRNLRRRPIRRRSRVRRKPSRSVSARDELFLEASCTRIGASLICCRRLRSSTERLARHYGIADVYGASSAA